LHDKCLLDFLKGYSDEFLRVLHWLSAIYWQVQKFEVFNLPINTYPWSS